MVGWIKFKSIWFFLPPFNDFPVASRLYIDLETSRPHTSCCAASSQLIPVDLTAFCIDGNIKPFEGVGKDSMVEDSIW